MEAAHHPSTQPTGNSLLSSTRSHHAAALEASIDVLESSMMLSKGSESHRETEPTSAVAELSGEGNQSNHRGDGAVVQALMLDNPAPPVTDHAMPGCIASESHAGAVSQARFPEKRNIIGEKPMSESNRQCQTLSLQNGNPEREATRCDSNTSQTSSYSLVAKVNSERSLDSASTSISPPSPRTPLSPRLFERKDMRKMSTHSVSSKSSTRSEKKRIESASLKRRKSIASLEKRSLMTSVGDLQRRILEIVSTNTFDNGVALLILANGILIGLQTEYLAREGLENSPMCYQVAEVIFSCIFAAELLLRLFAYRCSFFTMSQREWNIFDLCIVVLQLIEIVLPRVALGAGVNFNILRFLRLVRVVRLVRTMRLLPELRTIFSSIASSVKPLFWTAVLLALTAYVVGIALTQLVHQRRLDFEKDGHTSQNLDKYWGGLPTAVFTLVQSITGGLDWDVACRPLIEEIGLEVGLLFTSFILFCHLALLNVITGLFIDAVMENGKKNKEYCAKQHLEALFQALDVKHEGDILWDDFESQLDKPEMKSFFSIVDVDICNAKSLFDLLDVDSSGSVDVGELLDGCLRIWSPAKDLDMRMLFRDISDLRHQIQDVFALLDSSRKESSTHSFSDF